MSIKPVLTNVLINTVLLSFLLLGAMLLSKVASAETLFNSNVSTQKATKAIQLDVHKNASCGCCGKWVEHLNTRGFNVATHNEKDMSSVKNQHGIAAQYRSCHTGVSKDGYVFEGHIPAKVIQKFLKEKPASAIGLAVPGMPVGSPGMEVGNKFMPYQILLLKSDGTSEVYAHVNKKEEQYE